jgi:hypothetical protein
LTFTQHIVSIGLVFPLGDDSFQVTLTRGPEQTHTVVDEEVGVQHKRRGTRDDLPQRRLPFEQRLETKVTSIQQARSNATNVGG